MKSRFWDSMAAWAGILLCAGFLVSCSKEAGRYEGSYSFKTSGSLLLRGQGGLLGDSAALGRDSLVAPLVNEFGQMNVVVTDKHAQSLLVTMNVLGGDAVSFEADASSESIVLRPKERHVLLRISDLSESRVRVEASGTGHRYGDVLLFEFDYQGTVEENGIRYQIASSQVECVAERNED